MHICRSTKLLYKKHGWINQAISIFLKTKMAATNLIFGTVQNIPNSTAFRKKPLSFSADCTNGRTYSLYLTGKCVDLYKTFREDELIVKVKYSLLLVT